MKKLLLLLLTVLGANAQTMYLNTSLRKIYRANADNSITLLVTTDVLLNDIAIDTNDNFYGITNNGIVVSIDMGTGATTALITLPNNDSTLTTSLVCNDQNELFFVECNQPKLYKYAIASNTLSVIGNTIATPGDLTFYKGNLIFPVFTNNWGKIMAYDLQTSVLKIIFCGEVEENYIFFHGLTNQYTSCEENQIIGWNLYAKSYDLDNNTTAPSPFDPLINWLAMTVNGLATDNEYMASNPECYANLEAIDCESLGLKENQFATVEISPNPASETFTIKNKKEITTLEILDTHGRFVKAFEPIAETFDISDLQNGLYLLKISQNHQTMFKKLVKN